MRYSDRRLLYNTHLFLQPGVLKDLLHRDPRARSLIKHPTYKLLRLT